MSTAGKKLRGLERRYNFLMNRIKIMPGKDFSFDKMEASALKWAIEELSDKYNFQMQIDNNKEVKEE